MKPSVTWFNSLFWLTYRLARRAVCTVAGRNPLGKVAAVPGLNHEWRSVNGLTLARSSPPLIGKTSADGFTLWETRLGSFWVPPGARPDYVGRLLSEMLSQVYDLSGVMRNAPAPVILDCGANVGFFTRFALNSGASHVVSVEPSPGNQACLKLTLSEEIARGRVTLIEQGVWDREKVLSFSTRNTANPGGHYVVEDQSGDTQVPVTTIDRICQRLSLPRLDYIKLDVEGSELRAIAGASTAIRKFRPWLCIATEHTNDLFENARAVIDAVRTVDSSYECLCLEQHVYKSPSRGRVLTPFSLLFRPTTG